MNLLPRGLASVVGSLVIGLVGCAAEAPAEEPEAARADTVGDTGEEQVGWSCTGLTSSKKPADSRYFITSFGCWTDSKGNARGDGDDNCHPSCEAESRKLCGSSGTWSQCERKIRWYAADADRFGCGAKLKVTNPTNKKTVIVAAIDRGPNCRIEQKVSHAVLDLSYEASIYLYGEGKSATERAAVVVEPVGPSTPLGPSTGNVGGGEDEDASDEDNADTDEGCPLLTYPSGVKLQTKRDAALTASYGADGPLCFLDVDDLRDTSKNVRYATNVRLSPNFRLAELASSGLSSSRRVLIDPAFVGRLQSFRDRVGPVTVESGFVTPKQIKAGTGSLAQSFGLAAVVSSDADQQDEIATAQASGFPVVEASGSNVLVSLKPLAHASADAVSCNEDAGWWPFEAAILRSFHGWSRAALRSTLRRPGENLGITLGRKLGQIGGSGPNVQLSPFLPQGRGSCPEGQRR